ncbi:MAG: hypothetical protein DRJ50_13045 [Actinobacteria bacterium]|nr:MAG: hypothetical protein DRJ50_13045 [Actinomycetota bacterium]
MILGVSLAGTIFVSTRASARKDHTVALIEAVDAAIAKAESLQQAASLASVRGSESRRVARHDNTPQSVALATEATAAERLAYVGAADAWEAAGVVVEDALASSVDTMDASAREELRRLRYRTQIGTGDLAGAAENLEAMLKQSIDSPDADPAHRIRVREDLVMAYYHAARLMRLRGDPERAWRLVSERARQHARVLAEGADPAGGLLGATTRRQYNLEVIMEFERTPLDMLDAEALPVECPGGNCKNLNLDTWPWKKRQNNDDSLNDDRGVGDPGSSGGG